MSSDPDKRYLSDWTPLHIAVWRHDFEQTRQLANRSSVRCKDDKGWTPVHLACASADSLIFTSHQVSRQPIPSWSSSKFYRPPPPRPQLYGHQDDNERANAMGILEILLQHRPSLGSTQFPTPLHCAASSGWLSHVRALFEAGALVYTGPECSPLCWAKDGCGGNLPATQFLREQLGEVGLAMIEADHERSRGAGATSSIATSDELQSRYQQLTAKRVLPRPEEETDQLNKYGLCQRCAKMTFKDLISSRGYYHHRSFELVRRSAARCKLCKIVSDTLSENREIDDYKTNQVIIRMSNGNKGHGGICTDPPALRVLEFRLSAGCTCITADYTAYTRGALDFAKCRGSCPALDVQVDIFSKTGE